MLFEQVTKHKTTISVAQQDCIQFLTALPAGSVDVLVTDPAYSGMNNKLKLGRGRIVGTYNHKGQDNAKWFAEFEDTAENYELFLAQCRRVLKPTGHIYIMFDSFSLLTLGGIVRNFFDVKNLITWDKVNVGMGHYYRRRHEYILFATNGNSVKIKNRSFPDVWRIKRIHKAYYPTQKPVEVFDVMLSASAQPGFTVCDPFSGSGSAAISAIKNRCHFVGCDVSAGAIRQITERVTSYIETGIDPYQPKSCVPDGERVFW